MGNITINGRSYSGRNVSIINGQVIIDGKVDDGFESTSRIVEVRVTGDLCSLRTDASVVMHGQISGNLNAGGSVSCDDVGGNISAGGSVNCDNVSGSVTAGGSVNH
jgi:hypothetical protein